MLRVPNWNDSCEEAVEPQIENIMTPLDPVTLAPATRRTATAPPYIDEDPNLAMVERGLEAAENETRDAVADLYESSALRSEEPGEALDDIDFGEAGEEQKATELAAMHEDWIPSEHEKRSL
jgi:hypothetical protein